MVAQTGFFACTFISNQKLDSLLLLLGKKYKLIANYSDRWHCKSCSRHATQHEGVIAPRSPRQTGFGHAIFHSGVSPFLRRGYERSGLRGKNDDEALQNGTSSKQDPEITIGSSCCGVTKREFAVVAQKP